MARGSGLVDIVRDFLLAHGILRRIAERYRAGTLHFDEVRDLVGDDESAVLYRLKERSHALFRERDAAEGASIAPGILFDLAIGSLFHEAMKFRENFYQRTSYGPKVRALRKAVVRDTTGLLHEFEKILEGSHVRLDESLQEAETLLSQTTSQFRLLLAAHADQGAVTRYLVEHADRVQEALGEDLDAVLDSIHGSAGAGWAAAARSYLASGFFGEARSACEAAAARGERPAQMRRSARYAAGMQAYLEGRFHDAVHDLAAWLDAGQDEDGADRVRMALAVVSRLGQLVEPEADGAVSAEAAALAEKLRTCATRDLVRARR